MGRGGVLALLLMAVIGGSAGGSCFGQPSSISEITIEHFGGYGGGFPDFKATLKKNGMIYYRGDRNVKHLGYFVGHTDARSFDRLAEFAIHMNYFRLRDRYLPRSSDADTTLTSIVKNGKRKTVSHSGGNAPDWLWDFEKRIDTVVDGAENWKVGRPDPPLITLHLKNTPFLTAVQTLFAKAESRYGFDSQAAEFVVNSFQNARVTLDLKDIPFPRAVALLLCRSGAIAYLKYREGVFSLGEGLKDLTVSVHFVNADLLEALKTTCDQIGADYAFNLDGCSSRPITLKLENVPFSECLSAIREAAQTQPALEFSTVMGMAVVGRGYRYDNPPPPRDFFQDKIYLRCQQQNLYYALCGLLFLAEANFQLDPELKQYDISLTLNRVSLSQALDTVLHRAKIPISYRYENNIISVVPRE
jgi:hypothetical protein